MTFIKTSKCRSENSFSQFLKALLAKIYTWFSKKNSPTIQFTQDLNTGLEKKEMKTISMTQK